MLYLCFSMTTSHCFGRFAVLFRLRLSFSPQMALVLRPNCLYKSMLSTKASPSSIVSVQLTVPEVPADAICDTPQFKTSYTTEVVNTHAASSSLRL